MLTFLLALATTAVEPPSAPVPLLEPLICKREPVTGSLARFRKICKTAQQWGVTQNQAQDSLRDMQDHGLINSESPK